MLMTVMNDDADKEEDNEENYEDVNGGEPVSVGETNTMQIQIQIQMMSMVNLYPWVRQIQCKYKYKYK